MLIRNIWRPCLILCLFSVQGYTSAEDIRMDADALAGLIAAREANEGRVGTMHFHLQNSKNQVRKREALMLHSERENVEKIAIFFTQPSMIEDTAFLSLNHDTLDDENWLYLPATERVRRLPSSDRGDYFLGTDLTYGDIKDNFKFGLDDWAFSVDSSDPMATDDMPVLSGKAISPEVIKETGYSSFRAKIDIESAFPVWVEYKDAAGDLLKIVEVLEIELIGNAHTAIHFTVKNLQTGHNTIVNFTQMRYVPELDDMIFDPEQLGYGLPDVDE